MNKQTVYIPTKVEDELPDIMESVVTISNNNKYSVHQRVDSEVYKDDLVTLTELHDKYGFLNFGNNETFVTNWLKPIELYVFTPEELKQLLQDYTNKIVKNVELKERRKKHYGGSDGLEIGRTTVVDKKSITSQLPEFLKEMGYEA